MGRLPEEERLAALAGYDVLDTSPEAAFEELARLAAAVCETPMALVSFVDRDRQWFKSAIGVDATETPRAISFCAHTIEGEGPFVVADARADRRFADNPLVTGPMSLQFYAGVPITDDANAALGTLCVLDTRPRVLTPLQLNALRVLANQLLAQLELRRLLAREESLRAAVELAHRRAAFLADAAKLLAASLDTDRTLEAVARLTVPTIADVCTIVVCGDDGGLRRIGEAAADASAADATRRLREMAGPDSMLAMRHAIDARRPVLFVDYETWITERRGASHPYVDAVRMLAISAVISAPMMLGATCAHR
jgi:hypothetical protein